MATYPIVKGDPRYAKLAAMYEDLAPPEQFNSAEDVAAAYDMGKVYEIARKNGLHIGKGYNYEDRYDTPPSDEMLDLLMELGYQYYD